MKSGNARNIESGMFETKATLIQKQQIHLQLMSQWTVNSFSHFPKKIRPSDKDIPARLGRSQSRWKEETFMIFEQA